MEIFQQQSDTREKTKHVRVHPRTLDVLNLMSLFELKANHQTNP